MANFPGRFFRVPIPRHSGLGDLPETALRERGEYRALPPVGLPPPGSDFIPSNPGSTAQAILNDRQSNWQSIPFSVGTDVIKLQDFLLRKFLVLQNLSATGTIFVGFGWTPTAANALTLAPGVGYEPFSYPTNEIYVVASLAATAGLLIYGS